MTDKRVITYDTNFAAWSAVPDEERRRLLLDSVTTDVVFHSIVLFSNVEKQTLK